MVKKIETTFEKVVSPGFVFVGHLPKITRKFDFIRPLIREILTGLREKIPITEIYHREQVGRFIDLQSPSRLVTFSRDQLSDRRGPGGERRQVASQFEHLACARSFSVDRFEGQSGDLRRIDRGFLSAANSGFLDLTLRFFPRSQQIGAHAVELHFHIGVAHVVQSREATPARRQISDVSQVIVVLLEISGKGGLVRQ